jgi:hypothetical protein
MMSVCLCVPLTPESRNCGDRTDGCSEAVARQTPSRGNEYTCNNRRTVGRGVSYVVRVV